MANLVEVRKFVKTNVGENNNKIWQISLYDDGSVVTENGRVGAKLARNVVGNGRHEFDKRIRGKTSGKDPYREVETLGDARSDASASKQVLATAAEQQIAKGDPVIASLVRDLAEINRHEIMAASGGQMSIDLDSGVVTTPVGVVTRGNVSQARTILSGMENYVLASDFDNSRFISMIQDYLSLIPQKVQAKRGWHRYFLTDDEGLQKQNGLLDQLESSIDIVETKMADAKAKSGDGNQTPSIFDVSLSLITEGSDIDDIVAFYERGRKGMHASGRALKMARVFSLDLSNMTSAWGTDGEKVGGVMRLWHGTRAHNLLSILKSGLIIADRGGSINITGRMFGNGAYFSDQSSKSLNYSWGYWDGGAKDGRCFMLLTDVAMGRPWHPDKTGSGLKPPAGYDSIYARGGQDGVMNNEMIVFRTSQVKPLRLVEFVAS